MKEAEISLKKDLYVHLAFTLFGHLIAHKDSGQLIAKALSFVTTPEGEFFFLARISDHLEHFLDQDSLLFVLVKEGRAVSDMWDIHIQGHLSSVDLTDQRVDVAKKLFENKSPYLGTVGFLDLQKDYALFSFAPERIFFQNLGKQREGEPSYSLLKEH